MSYSLHFQDGSSQDAVFRGNVLMKDGVVVHLLDPLSSEVVFLEEAGGSHSPH